jgi:putative transposase
MQKTYKFRLYPTKENEALLSQTLEHCRLFYNYLLSQLKKQKKPDRYELQNLLPDLKKQHPELNEVYSKALQYEVYRLFSAKKALHELKKQGRKTGRLRFKPANRFKTIHYNQSGFKLMMTGKRLDLLRISKVGEIPIMVHRPVEGTIKQVVVKHYPSGKWFACITAEQKDIVVQRQPIKTAVGLDMGLDEFLTDSDRRIIENPVYLMKSLKRLKQRQRHLSKTAKGSKNRAKQIVRVARLHEHVANQRDDFSHKLSRWYVDHYDLIAVEQLNIRGMLSSLDADTTLTKVEKRHMRRKILDTAWYRFHQMLSCKAEWAGKTCMRVDPSYTSQIQKYGSDLDRDYNASLNILERALQQYVGQGLPELTSVDIRPLRGLITTPASLVVETGSPFLEHRKG